MAQHTAQQLAEMKLRDLQWLAKERGADWIKANLPAPVSKVKKADLVAALAVEEKADGRRKHWDQATLDRVVALRHDELLSWRKIADEFGWASSGSARRAYRAATGCTGTLPRIPGKGGRPTAAMIAGETAPVLAAPADDAAA